MRVLRTPRVRPGLGNRYLAPDEVQRLITHASSTRDRLILQTLYYAGLRVSELCGLVWRDVRQRKDLDSVQLAVLGKGGIPRQIPVPAFLGQALLAQRGNTPADENLVLASPLTGDPLLLIGNHGCAKTHVASKVAQALGRAFLVYELFTTRDLMRRAELLLTEDLGELAVTKAWSDLLKEKQDITLLAYTALQVEARRPGTVPRELLGALSSKMGNSRLSTDCIPRLENDDVEYIAEVEALLRQDCELAALVAYGEVAALVATGHITPERLKETARRIKESVKAFETLLEGRQEKGAQA